MNHGEILQPNKYRGTFGHICTHVTKNHQKRAFRSLQGRSADKVVRISIKVHDQAAEAC